MSDLKPRRPLDGYEDTGYMESDNDYVANNIDLAVALLDRQDALQALADELATFLTDEEHGSDGMSGDDGASNLGAFIQQARGLSDCRPKRHSRSCECGACPERS